MFMFFSQMSSTSQQCNVTSTPTASSSPSWSRAAVEDLIDRRTDLAGSEKNPSKGEFRVAGAAVSEQLLDKLHRTAA